MTIEDYEAQTGFVFLPPQNPGDYPPTLGSAQYQALRTKYFRQNQVMFRKHTTVDKALKMQIVTAVEPVLLSPLVDNFTGFGKVYALTMLQHLFASYGVIGEINLEENAVKMMGPYNPAEPLSQLIKQLEKGG